MDFTFKLARRLAQSHILGVLAFGFLAGSCAPGKPLEGGLEPPPDDVLAIHLVPDSVSLNPTEFVDFTAIAELQSGPTGTVAVTWQAEGGTISPAGRYTAGSTAGVYRVIGQYQGGPADTAKVVVTVAPPPPPVLTGIRVTPVTVALLPGASQQFSAAGVMTDGSSSSVNVNWTTTGGTVTAGGNYTAPTVAGNYLVVATQQGGSFSDTAQVSVAVTPPTLTGVLLTPPAASLEFGRTQQFTAVGQLSDGSTTSIAITWTATGGSVSGTGLYTAGSTAGSFRVIARSANGLADTSTVTVTAPTITAVTITPPTASLQSGQTQQFTASATLSNGTTQPNPSLTWVATGGAINGSGLFTAGATAGSFRVIGTSANGRADTSAVTISTPTITAITVTPATASLSNGQTRQFSAEATLSNGGTQANPSVTWSATGGTITTGGLYTAGGTAGSFRVIAAAANGPADTSTVTITVATVTAIVVTPASTSVTAGQTQQFSAAATLSTGGTQSNPSVTWSATGGSISASGVYTAGSTTGTFQAIAVQQGGTLADTAAVTITAPGTGPYPNRPATYGRVLSDYAFDLASYPAGSAQYQDAPDIGDGSGWGSVGGALLTRALDPTAPRSPSNTLQWTFGPGPGGTGVGMLYRTIPADVQELYVAFSLWHDPNFEWNTISNKLLYWSTISAQKIILESRFNENYWSFYIEAQDKIVDATINKNVDPTGRWVNVEVQMKRGTAGFLKVWINGQPVSNYSGSLPLVSGATDFNINSTWGGGGTRTRTSYRRIDHILIATTP
jgi:hypothetical protein